MKTQTQTTIRALDTHAPKLRSRLRVPEPRSTRKAACPEPPVASARIEPQLSRGEVELVPAVFLDSSTRVGMVAPSQIRRVQQFSPVVIFMPKPSAEGPARPCEVLANLADAKDGEVRGLLEKAVDTKPAGSALEGAFGAVTVSFTEMAAWLHDQPAILTTMEFKALKYLMQNPRRVISRDELLNQVWGYENYPCTRTVDNHILRLRQKLEQDPSRPVHFKTVRGVGYKFLP